MTGLSIGALGPSVQGSACAPPRVANAVQRVPGVEQPLVLDHHVLDRDRHLSNLRWGPNMIFGALGLFFGGLSAESLPRPPGFECGGV